MLGFGFTLSDYTRLCSSDSVGVFFVVVVLFLNSLSSSANWAQRRRSSKRCRSIEAVGRTRDMRPRHCYRAAARRGLLHGRGARAFFFLAPTLAPAAREARERTRPGRAPCAYAFFIPLAALMAVLLAATRGLGNNGAYGLAGQPRQAWPSFPYRRPVPCLWALRPPLSEHCGQRPSGLGFLFGVISVLRLDEPNAPLWGASPALPAKLITPPSAGVLDFYGPAVAC